MLSPHTPSSAPRCQLPALVTLGLEGLPHLSRSRRAHTDPRFELFTCKRNHWDASPCHRAENEAASPSKDSGRGPARAKRALGAPWQRDAGEVRPLPALRRGTAGGSTARGAAARVSYPRRAGSPSAAGCDPLFPRAPSRSCCPLRAASPAPACRPPPQRGPNTAGSAAAHRHCPAVPRRALPRWRWAAAAAARWSRDGS